MSKEQGYRSVQYLGDGKFRVDFSISGRLDHNFVYPFNPDADAIFPWIAIELRKDGTARMKAAAFGDMQSSAGMGQPNVMGDAEGREGSFTLTTDAELVMHNNEEGAAAPGRVTWRVTPSSKTVPTAVLRFGS